MFEKKKKSPTMFHKNWMENVNVINGFAPRIHLGNGLNEMKGLFFFSNPNKCRKGPRVRKRKLGLGPLNNKSYL